MIIYGTNGSLVRTVGAEPELACPACTTPRAMRLSVFSRYLHVYWIPLLPYTKPAVAQCTRCGGAWEASELPPGAGEVQQALRRLKKETRAPWWQWSGLAVLGAGLGWGLLANNQDERDTAAYVAAPQVGDVYTIRSADSTGHAQYSLLKVVGAQGNGVELVANEYVTDDAHPLQQLNFPERYAQESFPLTNLDLRIMLNKGELTDVDRLGQ
ncbi:hypothetical protein [Hymenobacter chitinivorans]|uniref:Zinc ribbon family protein n=1 Tax=Hymenobacter chitinivorans DSM 11115 TaxID=1121954 RepID=A0A2M9BSK5_9BACT|nr:hypothetical protein [Hymenobacter chitinivorans]PJJ60917.1 hypothetical protein CLV45_2353 [Hymenobacter chitinivorans DSM 11115]